ncbi:MAG: hypothetical protein RH917_08365 [Lacipirellulaceae bacterium]
MKIPLFIADAFESILGIVILVMAGLSQLLANRNPQGKPKPNRPNRVPRPQGAGGGGGGDEKLRQEVEDFLKRARGEAPAEQPRPPAEPVLLEEVPQRKPIAERQAERERQMRRERANQPRRPQQEPARRPNAPQRPTSQRQTPERKSPPRQQPSRVDPIRRGETVAEHVATHIDSHLDTAERVSHLGEEVGYADERLEEHLRTKFDHKLGSLERKPEEAKQVAAPTAAEEVVDLLTRPGGMQQVIIANEILKRPEF